MFLNRRFLNSLVIKEPPRPSYKIEIIETSTPANGVGYVVGESITLMTRLTNTGNVLINNIGFRIDSQNSLSQFILDVGDSVTSNFTNYSHTVTQEDCDEGRFILSPTITNYGTYTNNGTTTNIESDCAEILPLIIVIPYALKYTINTEATTTGAVLGEIPLSAVDTTKTDKITIDWGDGSAVEILPSQLSANKTHTYSTAGTYQITVRAKDWSNFQMDQNFNIGTFEKTLISIDEKLPSMENTELTMTFFYCEKLTSIPIGLFDNNTAVTHFSGCFGGCKSLISIPQDLFKYNTNVTDFIGCFSDCTSLTTIPTDLFRYNTAVTTFNQCFSGCSSLTSISTDLFRYNTAVTDFSYCFDNCTSLISIPTGLFDNNTQVTTFERCFNGCTSLTAIPTDLFKYNTEVTTFRSCFNSCTSLTSIPTGLFDNNTNVTSFLGTFYYCSGITAIPTDLFRYNTEVTSFYACFKGTGITAIPENIFRYNTEVTDFTGVFEECASLVTIPTDLFRYNTKVTIFTYCFEQCYSLVSLPTDLFKYNTLATSFQNCFYYCTSLTSIPTDLFRYNTAVTDFRSCFYSCSALNDFTIRIGSTKVSTVTSFVSKKTGTTRTIQVPTGSTTQTTFNNVASSLGLTIQAV